MAAASATAAAATMMAKEEKGSKRKGRERGEGERGEGGGGGKRERGCVWEWGSGRAISARGARTGIARRAYTRARYI